MSDAARDMSSSKARPDPLGPITFGPRTTLDLRNGRSAGTFDTYTGGLTRTLSNSSGSASETLEACVWSKVCHAANFGCSLIRIDSEVEPVGKLNTRKTPTDFEPASADLTDTFVIAGNSPEISAE